MRTTILLVLVPVTFLVAVAILLSRLQAPPSPISVQSQGLYLLMIPSWLTVKDLRGLPFRKTPGLNCGFPQWPRVRKWASCRWVDNSHRAVDNRDQVFLKEVRDEATAVSLGDGWRRGGPGR